MFIQIREGGRANSVCGKLPEVVQNFFLLLILL